MIEENLTEISNKELRTYLTGVAPKSAQWFNGFPGDIELRADEETFYMSEYPGCLRKRPFVFGN